MEKRCCCSRGHSLEQVPAASKGRGGLGSQFSILYKGGRNLQEGLPNYKAPLSPVGLALTVTQRPRLTCRREGLTPPQPWTAAPDVLCLPPTAGAFRLEVQTAFFRAASFSVIYLPVPLICSPWPGANALHLAMVK